MNANTLDILELISRGPDDPMTDVERAAIEKALAADASLAGDRAAYARLDRRLSRYCVLPNDVDWTNLSGEIAAEIRAEVDASHDADDADTAIVEALGRPLPSVDWEAFHARVSDAVRAEAAQLDTGRTIKWPAAFSWVAPLAAAALIAIVVWQPFGLLDRGSGTTANTDAVAVVVEVKFATPAAAGVVTVSFDDSRPVEARAESTVIPGGTVIVNGAWPTVEAGPAVDVETYYY